MLVQSLPVNFTETVSHLEQYLTATAIFNIVSSSDADQGNRQIMDCLVKQLTHQEDLLELCDRLEKIPDAPALTNAIEELRKGVKHLNVKFIIEWLCVYMYVHTHACTIMCMYNYMECICYCV